MSDLYLFPPEVEEGNREYKRKIDNLTPEKATKLKTQMLWRMIEGKNLNNIEHAIYYIGIDDNGRLSGISNEELEQSLNNFSTVVELCNAVISSKQITHLNNGSFAVIEINKKIQNSINNSKVCLIGHTDAGKSSFLSLMTYDILDNGTGDARNTVQRYFHEKQNGSTSSIKYEIIGFDNDKYINYNTGFVSSWELVFKNSNKTINFIDTPGDEKYLKTTLFALTAHKPDHNFIFVSITDIFEEKTENIKDNINLKYYIDLSNKLDVSFSIILTKNDLISISDKLINIFADKYNLKKYVIANNLDDYNKVNDNNFKGNVFIFSISNVTGNGIDKIKLYLNKIKLKNDIKSNLNIADNTNVEFMINDKVIIPHVGNVVSGILYNGRIKAGDKLKIGPYNNKFYNTKIVSIHKQQISYKSLEKGECASLLIKYDNDSKSVCSKYMTIFSEDLCEKFINNFKICISNKNYILNLKKDNSYMIFSSNIYDLAYIDNISQDKENVYVHMHFHNNNIQYLKNGEYVIIRYNSKDIIIGNILLS